jgi:hypothetical protein
MLPAQEMLRWCAMRGKGPYPKFPIEVVKIIDTYLARPVREQVAQELQIASRCFENRCNLFDHVDRDSLRQVYSACMEDMDPEDYAPFPATDPTDEQLEDAFQHESFAKLVDDKPAHEKNKIAWVKTIRRIFSTEHCAMFQRRFELDIWFSFVRLPTARDYRLDTAVPQATIAYLTLPGSITRQHSWSTNDVGRDEQDNPIKILSCGENGFGMAVEEAFREPTEEQRSNFQTALKYLNLRVSVHRSQPQYPALSTGAPDPDSSEDAEDSEKHKKAAGASRDSRNGPMTPPATIPQLTLLTRHNTHRNGLNF